MNFKPLFSIPNAHTSPISSLAFTKTTPSNPSSSAPFLLATASDDKTVNVYDLVPDLSNPKYTSSKSQKKYEKIWSYKKHLNGINQIKFNQDNNLLLTCGNDLSVNIMDVQKQSLLRNLRMDSVVTSLDINKYSNLIVSGTHEKSIVLHDLRVKHLIAKILSHSEPVTSVNFSSDSSVIFSTSYDSFCRIWDVFKFNSLKTISLENSPPLNNCCLLPNEKYILLSSFDNKISVINIEKDVENQEIMKFCGHEHNQFLIDCLFFEDEGSGEEYVVTGDERDCICSWRFRGWEQCVKTKVDFEDGMGGLGLQGDDGMDLGEDIGMKVTGKFDNYVINCLDFSRGVLAVASQNDKNNSVLVYQGCGQK